ncbi:hypothetical protein [Aeromicrobium piscarium]|uniref:Uncharacterized protein n=1 Tax=Aeromicrobium piscarium TaxID=2590901 RepID=A0A554SP33_9ACTN|nr:hypothetical protein [Aeromicrobium piscarium]TSD68116.1 hypothetical protein FNM00_00530 [Aeromicrobium piscarium]
MTEVNICQAVMCDRPVHDGWYVCKPCGDKFEREVLAEIEWLMEDIENVVTGQTRYVTQSASKSAETPLVVNLTASDARDALTIALDSAARMIAEENSWEIDWSDARGAARMLIRRISAIRLHPAGGQILDEIGRYFAGAVWVCDRPAAKQYLGDCNDLWQQDVMCPGKVYARQGRHEARCDTCGSEWEAEKLRERKLAELDGMWCTASEIAQLVTYLGLPFDRKKVRKRINQWSHREQIESRVDWREGETRYKFGEVHVRLLQDVNDAVA